MNVNGGPIVTASFDDGYPLDLRVAERLASRGLRGTFYVAWSRASGPEIARGDVRRLRAMGMEIGSHAFSGRVLTSRPRSEVIEDLTGSRKALEDLLGEPVTALSYPEGRVTRMVRAAVVECGYALARTKTAFRTRARFDRFRMPITIEFAPMTRAVRARRGALHGNARGLLRWWRLTRAETDPELASRTFFDDVIHAGGVFHLCARSRQIEQFGLWEPFDRVLDHAARWAEARYLTNGDAALLCGR